MRRPLILLTAICAAGVLAAQNAPQTRRNVIIFVADGLRYGSVNATDTPALWNVRVNGVNFTNSHSLFPTLTMPNASAIATGHYLGDTGQFANSLFVGYPVFGSGNFGQRAGAAAPSIEDDRVLGDIDDHFDGNLLGEETLLSVARREGASTAAIGKRGPAAIQDATEINPVQGVFREPTTVIIDDGADGIPVRRDIAEKLAAAGLPPRPPARNQPAGTNTTPGTLAANVTPYQWMADALTKAILPRFREIGKPFVVVYWSGDPDQTQHSQGDSLNRLVPGINGPTSKAAVRNADNQLKQILEYLSAVPELRDSTDVFVTADHGFSTISLHEIDADGHFTKSYSSSFIYKDAMGLQEVNQGFLPNSFLAIDLAHALGLPLYDPDSQVTDARGARAYQPVDPSVGRQTSAVRQRPFSMNGLIGGTGRISPVTDAKVVLAGTSIYVPDNDRRLVQTIVGILAVQDYIGGIFVNDRFGQIPGALPMSAVQLIGSARLPVPAISVNIRSFATDPADPLMTSVTMSLGGTTNAYQHGQGNHGSLSRANTFNSMAAIGPDFKKSFVDGAPVSNADVAPTLAHILGWKLPRGGPQSGRILVEALAGGPPSARFQKNVMRSREASGRATMLLYQQVGTQRYFDEACFEARPLPTRCIPATR